MRFAAAVLCVAAISLAKNGVAAAHVTSVPTFVTEGERQTVTLLAPNERKAPMSGFSVTVPSGIAIAEASVSDSGWAGTIRGATASWSGCCVASGTTASFSLGLTAAGEPRPVSMEAVLLYRDGEDVRWPVPLTVLPAEKSSGNLGAAFLIGGLGLLVVLGVVGFAWLRRTRSLQER